MRGVRSRVLVRTRTDSLTMAERLTPMSDSDTLPLGETHEPICPHCLSVPLIYVCRDCSREIVLRRGRGLTTSPQQTTTRQQWSRVPEHSPRTALPGLGHEAAAEAELPR
jgi:hypothetical protein